MKLNNFRVLAAIVGWVILASPTNAAVQHRGSTGMSAHRAGPSSHAFHQTAGHVSRRPAAVGPRRRLAHGGTVAAHGYAHRYSYAHRLGHRYGYGGAGYYGGTAVVGTYGGGEYSDYAGGGYRYGYGSLHHSCRWYYYHEPYNVPYRCRSYGYGYSYEDGGPSYAVSYGYGYGHWHGHDRFAWSGGRHGGRHPTAFVGANHIHAGHPAHIAGEPHFATAHGGSGAHLARMGGHPRLH
jgi:hypothetical protein